MEIKFFVSLAAFLLSLFLFLPLILSQAAKAIERQSKKPEPNFIILGKIVPGSIRYSSEETSEAERATQQAFQRVQLELSRLNAIQSDDLLKLFGRVRRLFRPSRKEIRRRKNGFMASMQRDTPRVPARWIPSTRKRKKLRRKLTPQYL
ncbi:hypothetical protein D1640_03565 [Muribaculaceae bacterium S4]|nr:hypothetical protein [Muribaculaceae bacterium S4]